MENFDPRLEMIVHLIELLLGIGIFAFVWLVARDVRRKASKKSE